MKNIIYKLLLGKTEYNFVLPNPAIKNQILIIKRIWNNEDKNDIGIEKVLRLFLATIQFVFPAIYMRHLLWKKGYMFQTVAIELYVLCKTLLPLLLLLTGLYKIKALTMITIYFLIESICYTSTLIFASDQLVKPRSYSRNVLLLIIDYIQIVLDFAVIYGGFNLLSVSNSNIYDLIYFSFVTSTTIGYGDILPVTNMGKLLVCFQSTLLFVFVVLFLNFFSSKVDSKDYYDIQKEKTNNDS